MPQFAGHESILGNVTERESYLALVHAPGEVLEVRPYDFERPELLGGDARDRLDAAFVAWGRQLGMQITAKTRAVVDVAVSPSEVQSFAAFIASAEGPVLWATAMIGGGRALYRIPLAEARYWAERMIGAAGSLDSDRAITMTERALARSAAAEHVADLRAGTNGLLPDPVMESFGPEPSAAVDQDALAVVIAVDTVRRGQQRRLAIALDANVVLDRLGAVAPRQEAEEVTARVTKHLVVAPVEVALRFDLTRVGPDTVLDLAPGDLIPLAHFADRPLTVTLDGQPVLRAAVGGNGERLACVVVESNGELE